MLLSDGRRPASRPVHLKTELFPVGVRGSALAAWGVLLSELDPAGWLTLSLAVILDVTLACWPYSD